MRLESKKYLFDIVRAAASAMEFIAGKDYSDYVELPTLHSQAEALLNAEKQTEK